MDQDQLRNLQVLFAQNNLHLQVLNKENNHHLQALNAQNYEHLRVLIGQQQQHDAIVQKNFLCSRFHPETNQEPHNPSTSPPINQERNVEEEHTSPTRPHDEEMINQDQDQGQELHQDHTMDHDHVDPSATPLSLTEYHQHHPRHHTFVPIHQLMVEEVNGVQEYMKERKRREVNKVERLRNLRVHRIQREISNQHTRRCEKLNLQRSKVNGN